MGTNGMTESAKWQGKTIYRACSCGETAHDYTLVPTENGGIYVYRCRNCKAVRKTKVKG